MFTKESSPSGKAPVSPKAVLDSRSEDVVADTAEGLSEKTSQEMKVSIDENQESSSLRISSSSAFTTPKAYQKGDEDSYKEEGGATEAESFNAGDEDLEKESVTSSVITHSGEKEAELGVAEAEVLNARDQAAEQEGEEEVITSDVVDYSDEQGEEDAEAEVLNASNQAAEQEDEEDTVDDSRISGYSAERDGEQEIITEETAQSNAGELDDPNITHIADDYSQNPLIQLYDSGVYAANSMKLLLWASLPMTEENDVLEDAEQNIVPVEGQENSQLLVQGKDAVLTPVKVFPNIAYHAVNEGVDEDLPALIDAGKSRVVSNMGNGGSEELLPLSDGVEMSVGAGNSGESIPESGLKSTVVPSLKNVLDNPQVKFTVAMLGGEMILNPGLSYATDKINGVNQDKNIVDYYAQNFNGYGVFLFKAGVMFTAATVILPISPNYGVNMLVGKVIADGAYNAVMGDKQQLSNMASVEYLQSLSWLAAPAATSVLSPYLTSFIANNIPAQAEVCFKAVSETANKFFNEYAVIGGLVTASGPKALDLASSIVNKAVENAPKALEFVGELKHGVYEYFFHNNEGEL